MIKLISIKFAGNIFLIVSGLLALFHILVLTNIVSSDMVWGGQIADSETNLFIMEMVSLFATLVFMYVVAIRIGYLRQGKSGKTNSIGVWLVFAYLMLNTLGNLASGVSLENLIFTPVSLLLAFCAFRLAIEK